jgi:hypothetical protein
MWYDLAKTYNNAVAEKENIPNKAQNLFDILEMMRFINWCSCPDVTNGTQVNGCCCCCCM